MRMAGAPKRNNETVSGVFGLFSVNGNSDCSSRCPTPYSRPMTELQSISNNHVSFECACGHSAKMPVSLFIEKYGKVAILNEVVKKARCTRCKTKGNAESRVIFVGGSGEAMFGTRTRND